MKYKIALTVCGMGMLLVGCATSKSDLVLDCVGPQPVATHSHSTNGTLIVYSAYQANADFDTRDAFRPEYSNYSIFTSDGKLLQKVVNNSGTILQDPAPVSLPAGKYRVTARANGYGYVTVPVLITADRNTVVHLETDSPNAAAFNQSDAVRLPGGEIVGWRTAANP
jgi:hypothetical protein